MDYHQIEKAFLDISIDRCQDCQSTNLRINRKSKDSCQYICQECKNLFSSRSNTIFKNAKLSKEVIIQIIISFSENDTIEVCQKRVKDKLGLEITIKTIRKYYLLLLDSVHVYSEVKKRLINFSNDDVEIDETLFYKIKRGIPSCRLAKIQMWVFGIISRVSGFAVFYLVQDRSRQTLLPIIRHHCQRDCIIYSDCWSSYINLKQTPAFSHIEDLQNNVRHFAINHQISYVCKINPKIHTQKIERAWRSLKKYIKKFSPKVYLEKYLHKFWFDQFFNEQERIIKILNVIKLQSKI